MTSAIHRPTRLAMVRVARWVARTSRARTAPRQQPAGTRCVRGAVTPAQAATQGEHERHGWIEVRTASGPKGQSERECRRSHPCSRAARRVVVRQAFGSDAGADRRGETALRTPRQADAARSGSPGIGRGTGRSPPCSPPSNGRATIGNSTKGLTPFSSAKAPRKAAISAQFPHSAGSGRPQCAVTGKPPIGQTRQQRCRMVMMKSSPARRAPHPSSCCANPRSAVNRRSSSAAGGSDPCQAARNLPRP
jgi:hypothetical protein